MALSLTPACLNAWVKPLACTPASPVYTPSAPEFFTFWAMPVKSDCSGVTSVVL